MTYLIWRVRFLSNEIPTYEFFKREFFVLRYLFTSSSFIIFHVANFEASTYNSFASDSHISADYKFGNSFVTWA